MHMHDTKQLKTFSDILRYFSAVHGDRPAVQTLGGPFTTYAQLAERAAAVRSYLSERGVVPGERIALVSENRPEWPIWYLGITSYGAVVVPILTDFHPRQVAGIIEHAAPRFVVASAKTEAVLADVKLERLDVATAMSLPSADAAAADSHNSPAPDDLAAILYTSGTTGDPKGVMLTHHNIVSNAVGSEELVPIHPTDRLLSILPLAHTYECTIGFLTPALGGAQITYLGGPPTITKLLPALQEVRPTIMLSVPLILEKIYQARVVPVFEKLPGFVARFGLTRKLIHRAAVKKLKKTFGGSIRFFGVGGAPLTAATERFLNEGGFPYAIGYGLTETAPLLAGAPVELTRFRSTGPALAGVELRLMPVGDGRSEGEIQARGPNVMQGYYQNPEATAAVFTEDGWFKTGDLGAIDSDGFVFIRGRAKSVILGPSGENIYPEEIEAEIDADPLAEESLVLSAGNKLVARVRLNVEAVAQKVGSVAESIDPETLARVSRELLESLRKKVNAKLNTFSRISHMVLQIEALERTPTRKIKRFLYQDQTVA